ncbi:hypothetical protein G7046_g7880 [Stylonectria norvegica]|nr:hypothetical protein G7046_g7880 [Stylonectria norvegica]
MTDWVKLKVVDLKAELKRRGLAQTGLKSELVARLNSAEDEPAASGAEDDAPAADIQDSAEATPAEPEIPEEPEMVAEELEKDEISMEIPREAGSSTTAVADADADVGAAEEESRDEPEEHKIPDDAPAVLPKPEDSVSEKEVISEQDNISESDKTMEEPNEENKTEPLDEAIKEPHESPAQPDEIVTIARSDSPQESQKRKRRSATPPPQEEELARKRARPDDNSTNGDPTSEAHVADAADLGKSGTLPDPMDIEDERDTREPEPVSEKNGFKSPIAQEPPVTEPLDSRQDMDFERDVAPSVHSATSALYIKNLMRPLRPNDIQSHLITLATPPGDAPDDEVIVDFHLDQIRTHAFVVFKSTSAASRARTSLHDSWPWTLCASLGGRLRGWS